ncbi:insulinase family protein [Chryseobacterium indologenes]|uniref:M16 family metallopeptidase n=1 Tax=Chryseobacterium indologenes TaxID=253 RepID=UPI0011080DB8|nr:insulinase family protein [Chryseobacterium indologenes]TLX24700.1 insulinase family protein [Chryseobacterium indologenes]
MKKRLVSLMFVSLISTSFFGQNIPVDPSVKIGTLPNGMKYYIKKNALPEKKVDFRLAINAGSILEDENQRGLAHFMEHMNFNGTKNFPDNKLVDFLQSIGVKFGQHLNAYTGFDETVYMLPVPLDKPGNLDTGLKVMEDWAFNATLSDEQINKERGVVLEELRLGLGPDKRMQDKYLPKQLYKSLYAERLPIGDKKVLESFTPDLIRKFHQDWYRPDLMAIIVVGDINVEEVEKKIRDNFGKYKKAVNPKERKSFDLPNHKQTLVAIETDPDATSSGVQFMIKDKEAYKPDSTVEQYQQRVVEGLVNIMLNSRLGELINSTNPPFTYGAVYHGGTYARTKEAFQGSAVTKDGDQLNALKILLEEVERAKRFGFTPSELDRAKSQVLSSYEWAYNNRDKNESGALIGGYVDNFLRQEPIPGISWEYDQIKKFLPTITLTQTNAIIGKLVKDDSRVVVITGPAKDDIKMPTESMVLNTFENLKVADLKPYVEKVKAETLIKPFESKGKITKTETDAKLGTTTWTLNNGIKVTFKKTDFKDDEILFAAVSLGGSSIIPDADYNKTQFAFDALLEAGIGGLSKTDLTHYLAGKQVSASSYISGLTEGVSGTSSKKDLKTAMELIYACFTELNYNPESFNAYKTKKSAMLTHLAADPEYYFSSEYAKFVNQKNPRFIGLEPTEKDWKNTDYKKAYEIYRQKFANASNFHFYFVGNIDEGQLQNEALHYLANLPVSGQPSTFRDTGYRPVEGNYTKVYKKGKEPKSLVNISYSGETPYNEKEALALSALGEVATIKILEKLREDESSIYGGGASGGLSKVPYGTYSFSINFPCGPENVEKLIKSSTAELQKLIDKGPEQKDLDKYKEGEYNEYKTSLKDNGFWLQGIAQSQVDGSDPYDILNYQEKVKALTVKDLQDVAKKYLSKGRNVAVLMPEDGWEKTDKTEVLTDSKEHKGAKQ